MGADLKTQPDSKSGLHEFNNDLQIAMCQAEMLSSLVREDRLERLATDLCATIERMAKLSHTLNAA